MGFHPANLALRFVLEVVGLIGIFRLGLALGSGAWGWALAFAFTLAAMGLWANYRVPGDGSAKGDAPFPVAGRLRLLIELGVFGAGTLAWFLSDPPWLAWAFLGALLAHHALSYDRIGWLLRVDSDGKPLSSA